MSDRIDNKKIFLSSLRLFFAPLIGAYKAVVGEYNRLQAEHAK